MALLLMLILMVYPSPVQLRLAVRSVGSNTTFADPSNVVVGAASDLIIEVECFSEGGTGMETFTWYHGNGTVVQRGLRAFGMTQGRGGVLRIYPVRMLNETRDDYGGNNFFCTSDDDPSSSLDVTFSIALNPYFTSTYLLTFPDIPAERVTRMVNTSNSQYLEVQTPRGLYRSANLRNPIIPPYITDHPVDQTVQPVNGTNIGAFFCIVVNPSDLIITIDWVFEKGGEEITLNSSGNHQIIVGEYDSGSSLLILEPVTDEDEGNYYCVVHYYCCGTLTSQEAVLTYDPTPREESVIFVVPTFPVHRTRTIRGRSITLPYLLSNKQIPQVTVTASGNNPYPAHLLTPTGINVLQTEFTEQFTLITPGVQQQIFLLALSTRDPVYTVSFVPPVREAVVIENSGAHHRIRCTPSQSLLLYNGVQMEYMVVGVQIPQVRRSSGYYQCVSPFNEYGVDTTYLLVAFVERPHIIRTGDATLQCTAMGNPPPRLTWFIDPPAPIEDLQLPTGFMENVISNLNILAIGSYTITCTSGIDTPTLHNSSTTYTLTVEIVETSISISPNDLTVMFADDHINATCSVLSISLPVFSFLRNGVLISGDLSGAMSNDRPNLYFFNLTITAADLDVGTNVIACTAKTLTASGPTASTTVLVHAIFENLVINSSVDSVILREQPEVVTVTCFVTIFVFAPVFNVSLNGNQLPAPTFSSDVPDLYFTTLNLSSSQLNVGTEVVTCTPNSPQLSANTSIIVDVIFHNISIVFSDTNVLLTNEPEEATTCLVYSSLEPNFTFFHGYEIDVPGAIQSDKFPELYFITLNFTSTFLFFGLNMIQCAAELVTGHRLTSSILTLNVSVVLENLRVTTGSEVVIRHDDPELLTLTCTVDSSVTPIIEWRRNGEIVSGTPPTLLEGYSATYSSMLSLNDSDLLPPMEIFNCTAVPDMRSSVESPTPSLSGVLSIEVQYILQNITVSLDGEVIYTIRPQEENENGPVETLTCSLKASILPQVTWTQNGVEVNGTPARRIIPAELTVVSELTVSRYNTMGMVAFTCTAMFDSTTNLFLTGARISFNATVIFQASPVFITAPGPFIIPVTLGENATLSCSADGSPIPSITWESEDGVILSDNTVFDIVTDTMDFLTTSYITFVVSQTDSRTDDDSGFRCVASNSVLNRTESELGQISFPTPPGPPGNLTVLNITFESAVLEWTPPFSIVPITNYTLNIIQVSTPSDLNFTPVMDLILDGDQLRYEARPPFLVFSRYRVELAAINRLGQGATTVETFISAGRAAPEIVFPPEDYVFTEDQLQNVTFTCAASGLPLPQVSWIREINGTNSTIEAGDGITIDDPIVTVEYMLTDRGLLMGVNRSLTLIGVLDEDSALRYFCVANSAAGEAKREFQLIVRVPPATPMFAEEVVTVTQPEAAMFICTAMARPRPSITWYKVEQDNSRTMLTGIEEGVSITAMDGDTERIRISTLIFDPSRLMLSAVYVCVATNPVDTADNNATLNINVPPMVTSVYLDPSQTSYTVNLGDVVTFQCVATGIPAPSITWFRNGTELSRTDSRITFNDPSSRSVMDDREAGEMIYQTSRNLTLSMTEDGDSGSYECRTSNDATSGEDAETFLLIVDVIQPVAVIEMRAPIVTQPEAAIIVCDAVAMSRPSITWYKVEQDNSRTMLNGTQEGVSITAMDGINADRTRIGTLIIDPSRPSLSAVYVCVATDRLDNAEANVSLTVYVSPMVTSVDPPSQLVNTGTGMHITFQCVATGIPAPSITWLRNGTELTGSGVTFGDHSEPSYVRDNAGEMILEITRTLTWTSTQRSDTGSYECRASNDATPGEDTESFDLMVQSLRFELNGIHYLLDGTVLLLEDIGEGPIHSLICRTDFPTCCRTIDRGHFFDPNNVRYEGPRLDIYRSRGDLNGETYLNRRNNAQEPLGRFCCEAPTVASPVVDERLCVFLTSIVISPIPPAGTLVGQRFQLSCTQGADPGTLMRITWTTPTNMMTNTTTMDSFVLTIDPVMRSDEGTYTCSITYHTTTLTKTYQLSTLPDPTVVVSGGENSIEIGESTTFTCDVSGTDSLENPTLDYVWRKDGVTLAGEEGSSLILSPLVDGDSGIYSCMVTISHNLLAGSITLSSQGQGHSLTVVIPPTIPVITDVTVTQPEAAMFVCTAMARPRPSITWYKVEQDNSRTMLTGTEEGVSITAMDGDTDRIRISTLLFDPSRPYFSAVYVCAASNPVGTAETNATLNVYVSPMVTSVYPDPSQMNYTVNMGDVVTFQCVATGIPAPSITWFRNGTELSAMESRIIFNDPSGPSSVMDEAGEIVYEITSRNLTLSMTEDGDSGSYECRASNDATPGEDTESFELIVRIPPATPVITEVIQLTVSQPGAAMFVCTAMARPRPSITWYKVEQDNSRTMLTGTEEGVSITAMDGDTDRIRISTLLFDPSRPSFSAVYVCVASNLINSAETNATLTIYVSPMVTSVHPNSSKTDYITVMGEMITFQCVATGIPAPSITWLRNGTELSAMDSRITFNDPARPSSVMDEARELIYQSSRNLSLSMTKFNDSGSYECRASNDATPGEDTESFELVVKSPVPPATPVITEPIVVTVTQPEAVTFVCTAMALPRPSITWYKAEQDNSRTMLTETEEGVSITAMEGDTDTMFTQMSTLLFNTSRPSFSAVYVCVATNQYGSNETNATLSVYVSPTVTSVHPNSSQTDYIVFLGEMVTFQCVATGIPAPSITWLRNGTELSSMDSRITFGDPSERSVMNEVGEIVYQSSRNLILSMTEVNNSYECRASNDATPGEDTESFELKLLIPVPPATPVITEVIQLTVTQPGAAMFVCTAMARPRPSITWYKVEQDNSRTMLNGTEEGVSITAMNGDTDRILINTLLLDPSRPSFSAVYVCVASNLAGNAETNASLSVNVSPMVISVHPNPSQNDYIARVGEAVTFLCVATGIPAPSITWLRNGTELSAMDSWITFNDPAGPSSVMDEAGEIIYQTSRNLTLSMTEEDRDSGRYYCRASNNATPGEDTQSFELAVGTVIPPATPVITEPILVTVTQPEAVTFVCTGMALPRPSITWYKVEQDNSRTMLTGTEEGVSITAMDGDTDRILISTLILDPSRPSFSAVYVCVASNPVGSTETNASLSVYVSPTVTSVHPNPSQTNYIARVGEVVTFLCVATGIPAPTIKWLRNGTELSAMDSRITLNDPSRPSSVMDEAGEIIFQTSRNLSLSMAGLNDSGSYECRASNDATPGEDTESFQLTVGIPATPVITEAIEVTVTQPEAALFVCTAMAIPTPSITWYKVEQDNSRTMLTGTEEGVSITAMDGDTDRTRRSSLLFNMSRPSFSAVYVCVASNPVATAETNASLSVYVSPRVTSVYPDPSQMNYTVNMGEVVTFQCVATGIPAPSITWFRNGTELSAMDSRITFIDPSGPSSVMDEDGEMIHLQTSRNLTLSMTEDGDSGSYECIASNDATPGEDTESFELIVQIPPATPALSEPRTVTVTQPGAAMFVCTAMARPRPSITWYKVEQDNSRTMLTGTEEGVSITAMDGDTDRTENSTLLFDPSRPSFSAVYVCVASNPVDTAETNSTLSVYVSPMVTSVYPDPSQMNYTINMGEVVTFQCVATGIPAPSITWFRNGTELNAANSRITFIDPSGPSSVTDEDGEMIYQTSRNLTLSMTEDSDSGSYECIASNDATPGEDTGVFELIVQIPPATPAIAERVVTVSQPEAAMFVCTAMARPKPSITWYKMEQDNSRTVLTGTEEGVSITAMDGDTDRTQINTLLFDPTRPSLSAVYVCVASNPAGSAELSATLNVYVPPMITSVNPDPSLMNYIFNMGNTVTFQCVATGIPAPSITWFRNGTELNAANSRITFIDPSVPSSVADEDGELIHLQTTRNLTLSMTEDGDSGSYECRARNDATPGEDTESFALIVQIPPATPAFAEPRPVTVTQPEAAMFVCTGMARPRPSITWYKVEQDNSRTVLTGTEEGVSITAMDGDTDRIRMSTLLFDPSRPSFSAVYVCVASNPVDTAETNSTLSVYVSPMITSVYPDPSQMNYMLNMGNTVTFQCVATGIPTPSITWFRNGIELNAANSRITFIDPSVPSSVMDEDGEMIHLQTTRNLTLSMTEDGDSGSYECRARNDATPGEDTESFELIVQIPPATPAIAVRVVTVTQPEAAMFVCTAMARPRPSITWYKVEQDNSRTMLTGTEEGVSITAMDGDTDRTRMSTLLFDPSRPSLSAVYVCVASNPVATAETNSMLSVYVSPMVTSVYPDPSQMNYTVNMGGVVTFQCVATGIPAPSITWLRNGVELNVANSRITFIDPSEPNSITDEAGEMIYQTSRSLTLSVTEDGDSGRYECKASNDATPGEDTESFELIVRIPPATPAIAERVVTVTQPEAAMFVCTAMARPRPSITWYKVEQDNSRTMLTGTEDGVSITAMDGDTDTTEISILLFDPSRPSFGAVYVCVASNPVGTAETNATLSVYVSPMVTSVYPDPSQMNYTINMGEVVTFQCVATGIPAPSITWFRNGTELNAANSRITFIDPSGPSSVTDEAGEMIYQTSRNLTLSMTEDSDSGSYECIASNDATPGEDTGVFELIVQIPPATPAIAERVVTVTQPEAAMLVCTAMARPRPSITWYKVEQDNSRTMLTGTEEGVSITAMDGDTDRTQINTLLFDPTRPSLSAVYVCVASNPVGSAELSATLNVYVPPMITSVNPDPSQMNYIFNMGNTVTFQCVATGIPAPSITWFRNGIELNAANSRITFIDPSEPSSVMDDDGEMIHLQTSRNLTLSMTEDGDSGSYECRVHNDATPGEDTESFELIVQIPPATPVITEAIEVTVTQPEAAMFVCTAMARPRPSITWYKVEQDNSRTMLTGTEEGVSITAMDGDTDRTETSTLLFDPSRPSFNVSYICVASNPAGSSELGATLNVYVSPMVTSVYPDPSQMNYTVNMGDVVTFQCVATGIPAPSITWFRDDTELTGSRVTFGDPSEPSYVRDNAGEMIFEITRTLTLSATNDGDSASYDCRASNDVGDNRESFQLIVQIPPATTVIAERIVTVTEPEAAMFVCTAMARPRPSITWYKMEQDNSRTMLTGTEEGVSITARDGDTDRIRISTLLFDPSRPYFSAVYVCVASNPVSSSEQNVNLNVYVSPMIISTYPDPTQMNYTVNMRDDASFQCVATGIPAPSITWFRDGVELNKGDSRITFSNFSEPSSVTDEAGEMIYQTSSNLTLSMTEIGDSGSYECRANNDATPGEDTETFDLTIEPIELCRYRYNLQPPRNLPCDPYTAGRLIIDCEVTYIQTEEAISIQWSFRHQDSETGYVLRNTSKYTITPGMSTSTSAITGMPTSISQSQLVISMPTESDVGEYDCQIRFANNTFTEASQRLDLFNPEIFGEFRFNSCSPSESQSVMEELCVLSAAESIANGVPARANITIPGDTDSGHIVVWSVLGVWLPFISLVIII